MKTFIVLFCILCANAAVAQRAQPQPVVNARIAALEKDVARLEREIIDLRLQNSKDTYVTLDMSAIGSYQRISSNNGLFLVSVENVEKYLDGYKVTLKVGNITSATFNGFGLTVRWGSQYQRNTEWRKWWESLRTKNENFARDLMPGRWNTVQVILLATAQDELGFFQIALDTNKIVLYDERP